MSRFFSIDNVVFRGISRVGDILLLSIMTLLCCIPVITAGAALTALFDVSIKILRGRDTGTIKNFFVSFKRNFFQSTIIWLIFLPIGIGVYCLSYAVIFSITDSTLQLIVGGLCIGIIILYAFSLLFVFPVQAVFDNPVKATIRTAFSMSMKHFGTTLALLAAVVAIVYFSWMYPIVAYLFFFFGIGAFGLIFSTCYLTVFRKYNPALNPDPEELKYHPMMTKEEAKKARKGYRSVSVSGKVIR